MRSRMDKYYEGNDAKDRTSKNQQLYRTIYEQAEYSNVEGISIIEKNEKIDMDMIKELINKNNKVSRVKEKPIEISNKESNDDFDDDKSYDIRDVLSKAKDGRVTNSKKITDTQYNILKGININDDVYSLDDMNEDDLKSMIERISSNSKYYTENLLDDLKSIYDPTIREQIDKKEEKQEDEAIEKMDKSFYTSTLGINKDDFEDANETKEENQSSVSTKILLSILALIIITGIVFLVFHFLK